LEKLVNSKPKKMNWAWCLGYVIQGNGNLNNASTVIKLLSRNGVDMNIAYDEFSFPSNNTTGSPLLLLIAKCKEYTTRQLLDVAETLIAEGADVNGNKARGEVDPISFALYFYQVELASLLLEKGADVKVGNPLVWAAAKGFTDIVPALIAKGANMNYRFGEDEAPIIVVAAFNNHFDIVRLLVDKGANVNLRDDDGKTAASIAYEKGEIEVYNYLKAHGAIDFEPKQVAQAAPAASPQSTTNVYVAPSQSAAPAQSAPAQPSYRLQPGSVNGTYRGSAGGSMQISYSTVAFFDSANKSSGGSASLSGSTLTVSFSYGPLGGRSFTYRVDSDSQFSGNGETYSR
jgi:hypothetical protein